MYFVTFNLAKKLKEKGFTCQYPIAMYNELGRFYALYTSADHNPNIKSVFGNREYYDYDDFDDKDYVCPTISQVLEWLRKEKKIHITIDITNYGFISSSISFRWDESYCENEIEHYNHKGYRTYEEAALAEINYVLDNFI